MKKKALNNSSRKIIWEKNDNIFKLCMISKEAFVFPESIKEDEWMKAVKDSLHPLTTYTLVRHVRLVGMLLIIYSRYR